MLEQGVALELDSQGVGARLAGCDRRVELWWRSWWCWRYWWERGGAVRRGEEGQEFDSTFRNVETGSFGVTTMVATLRVLKRTDSIRLITCSIAAACEAVPRYYSYELVLCVYTSSHAACMMGRSLVTYQYLRICTDIVLKYHTKSADVSTGRRHGDTPKNSMEIWYVYTESGAQ